MAFSAPPSGRVRGMAKYPSREELLAEPDVGDHPKAPPPDSLLVRFAARLAREQADLDARVRAAVVGGEIKHTSPQAARWLLELYRPKLAGRDLSGRRVPIPLRHLLTAGWRVLCRPLRSVRQTRTEIDLEAARLLVVEGTDTSLGSSDLTELEIDHRAARDRAKGGGWWRLVRLGDEELGVIAAEADRKVESMLLRLLADFKVEATYSELELIEALEGTDSQAEALMLIGAADDWQRLQNLQRKLQRRLHRKKYRA